MTHGGGGQPALDASASTRPGRAAGAGAGQAALGAGPVSRGYREEMEHFAYCIRMRDQGIGARPRPACKPRCDGRVAMADAIIALTANLAMKQQQRIEFKPEWFDADSAEVPDADMKPEVITG